MAERSIVRELVTLLGFDANDKELAKYEARVKDVKKNLLRATIAGGLLGGAIASIAVKTARAGDELLKTSQRLGLNIKALQEWRFVAERSGVSAATFDMAMQRFGRRAAEAARGTGEARQALFRLGVEVRGANGSVRDMDVLLEEALTALSKVESPLERNALAMKLFDSEGVRLVQMLENGIEGTRKLREEFRKLGGAMDKQTAELARDGVDAWTNFTTAINGVIYAMGKELLPVLTEFLKIATTWISNNRGLITTIAWIVFGIVGLTAAVLAGVTVWHAWAAAIALVNAGLLLMILKIGAIVAFFGLIALLAEDLALFLSGRDVDTVTGRAVGSLRDVIKGIWDWIVGMAMHLIDSLMPVWMQDMLMDVMDWLKGKALGVVQAIGQALRSIVPQEVLDAIDYLFGPGKQEDVFKGRAHMFGPGGFLEQPQPRLFGPGGAFAGLEKGRGAMNVNVTVNQMPGETGAGVTQRVVEGLAGQGVVTPLNGLAP